MTAPEAAIEMRRLYLGSERQNSRSVQGGGEVLGGLVCPEVVSPLPPISLRTPLSAVRTAMQHQPPAPLQGLQAFM